MNLANPLKNPQSRLTTFKVRGYVKKKL